jgi:MATE family multidrug resistance protein
MVGRALGAGRMPDADRATNAALKLAAGFMAACGVVFAIAGGAIARAFTDDVIVAQTAQRLLWVAAIFQVLDAVNIVLRGALRGAKDVRYAAFLGIAIVWTCVPTAAFFLGKLAGLGALGGWLGFIAETTIGAALFWRRWKRGAWRATATSV